MTCGTAATCTVVQAAQATPPVDQPIVYYSPPSIKAKSSTEAIQLAKHLQKKGAKMYGAYWCSHCYSQKVNFGTGGAKLLGYVECAADGYQSERTLCQQKGIRGYPTWEIDGQFIPGERSLLELAELSGFPNPALFASEDASANTN